MQTQLPFFPVNTKLINDSVGFREQDGTVYYLHNGNPVYCHAKEDRNSYRFIMGSLVVNELCTISELSTALGEGRKNIERYAKAYREKGAVYFFRRKETRGQCYKMTEGKLASVQSGLDCGLSIYQIAKNESISESAISYHIKKGALKKTPVQAYIQAHH
jgi:DNA-binding transcriptional ArsR family regulator